MCVCSPGNPAHLFADCELPSSKVNQSHKCSTIPGSGVPNHHAAVKHETQSNSPVSSTGLPDALDAATENLADGLCARNTLYGDFHALCANTLHKN